MSKLEAVRNEAGQLQHLDAMPQFNIEALLSKAIDAKSAVEVMERLQAMRREIRAEQAKEAFDRAMADFQAEVPIIQKTKFGAKEAYRYAPLDAIVEQVRDLIRKHGFSFTITSEIESGWCKAFCKVTHAAGHSETSEFKVPVDNKNPMMTEPQRYGGAMTFSKRYALCNAFGILTADEDLDGGSKVKPSGVKPVADESRTLIVEIWNALATVRGGAKSWDVANQWLYREDILDGGIPETMPNLKPERLKQVLAAVKEKLK